MRAFPNRTWTICPERVIWDQLVARKTFSASMERKMRRKSVSWGRLNSRSICSV